MMATFREFLIAEALDTKKKKNGKESKYSDMKVKSDEDLAAAADKIDDRKGKREKGKEVIKTLRSRRGK